MALSLSAHLAAIAMLAKLAPLALPAAPPAPAIAVLFTAIAPRPMTLAQTMITPSLQEAVLSMPQPVHLLAPPATRHTVSIPPARQILAPAADAPAAPTVPSARAAQVAPPKVAPTTASRAAAPEADPALYVADVQRAVQQAAAYPPIARMRRLQGRVQVRFELARGAASDVSIAASSASPLLDRAALAAVAHARYPAVPGALTMVIWVDFSLTS